MFPKIKFLWAGLLMIFLHIPCLFSGEIYPWTDEKGTLHFTDNESKIPGQYSGRAKRLEVREEIAIQRPEDWEMGSRCFATS
jgi:hypothetical protein